MNFAVMGTLNRRYTSLQEHARYTQQTSFSILSLLDHLQQHTRFSGEKHKKNTKKKAVKSMKNDQKIACFAI